MAITAKELREKRAKLIADARKINDEKANAETGVLGAEDQAHFDKLMEQADGLHQQAKQIERLEQAEAALNEPISEPVPRGAPREPGRRGDDGAEMVAVRTPRGVEYVREKAGDRGQRAYREAFRRFLGSGASALNEGEYAALRSSDDSQGGYLVASEQFASGLLKTLDDALYIRRWATVYSVRQSKSLGIRTRHARMSTFAWGNELEAPTADTALKFGKKSLTPHPMTGEILVSRDLMNMAVMSPEMIVQEEMARNAGEVMEDAFLLGNGASQPLGLFVASDDGIPTSRDVSTDNTSTAITADGLKNAYFALKAGHRGNARWMFHRDAMKMISKLKHGDGHYMLQVGLAQDAGFDRLLGLPVGESERVPNTFTSGLYAGILGDFRHYTIVDGLDMDMQRLDELHARTNQVGFIGRLKTDGMPTLSEAFVRVKLG